MAEYIEREALLEDIENTIVFSGRPDRKNQKQMGARMVVQRIRAAQSADVAPVVHGRWEIIDHYPYPETIRCSACGREFGGNTDWIRCPLCEARMDGAG